MCRYRKIISCVIMLYNRNKAVCISACASVNVDYFVFIFQEDDVPVKKQKRADGEVIVTP